MMRRAGGNRIRLGAFAGLAAAVLLGACAGGMPKVPASPESVLQRADDLHKRGKHTQAAALYEAFLERFAGHDRADYAQYQLGSCHFDIGDYSVAAVEYQVIITNYGYSEWVDDALFQVGVCYWRQAPKAPRDQQMSVDALSRFNQYILTYPDGARVDEARTYVRQINERLAEKAITAARWYRRRHEQRAALIYCDKIIDDYPENRFWVEALYLKGTILLERGQNDDALAAFKRVLDYPEDHPLKRAAQEKLREAGK